MLPSFTDNQYVVQVVEYGVMLAAGMMLGYAHVATEFACKKYAFQCTWKVRKA
jgi:hypothetical protein